MYFKLFIFKQNKQRGVDEWFWALDLIFSIVPLPGFVRPRFVNSNWLASNQLGFLIARVKFSISVCLIAVPN